MLSCTPPAQIKKAKVQREKLRKQMQAQGRDEGTIGDAIHSLRDQQHLKEQATVYGVGQHLGETGGVDYYLIRFFNHIIEVR